LLVECESMDHAQDGPDGSAEYAYFARVAGLFPNTKVQIVCVTHFVPSARHFLPALTHLGHVALVLPKPKSVQSEVATEMAQRFAVTPLSREFENDAQIAIEALKPVLDRDLPLCLIDVGGYFATILDALLSAFPEFLGVVEGTENGHIRYERASSIPIPVYSVARSPLKFPENHLVGAGIVFSLETLMRAHDKILQGIRATVIGYGRIGRGVAQALRGRFVDVTIRDTDPVALAEAAAQGFQIARNLEQALASARVVICATGNLALAGSDFASLMQDAIVATVTSADDELGLDSLPPSYVATPLDEHLTLYKYRDRRFYLVNSGNAINFLHGAILGPAIHLIEGEKLACVAAVADRRGSRGLVEIDSETRRQIAGIWLEHFAPE
jgi:adenosylhomocysteinase